MTLGPTLLQSTIYLTLTKLGNADVTTISKASKVARSDVYRIMPSLQKMGLVEKIIAKTTIYKATPLKEGLTILLENKKRECAELEKETRFLIDNFHNNNLQDCWEQNQQFKVTSEWTLLKKMHEKMIQSAKTSIDITVPRKILQMLVFDQGPYLEEAKKRNVKIRAVTERVGGKKPQLPKNAEASAKNFFNETKYTNGVLFGMHIFDGKEVTLNMNLSPKDTAPKPVPSLWSNDPNVVKLAETYFEHIWNCTGKKIEQT